LYIDAFDLVGALRGFGWGIGGLSVLASGSHAQFLAGKSIETAKYKTMGVQKDIPFLGVPLS
jgi:hypothetical protein